jgi:glycosyltransferase involved in cell wall biosynthesis
LRRFRIRSVLAGRASANVRFVGHQGGDQLRELLDRAVASVVPSTWFENAPLTVLEAMRSGRPVIASRIGGHEEMLEHGGGTLVPVADVGGLASAVASLWTDRDAATRLGAEAREVFVRKYRIDTHMERLLTVYAEALGG